MSPKNDDDIRKLILERRARFLAAALATTGLHACTDSGPSVCLSIAMTPSPSGTTTINGTDATHTTGTSTSTTQDVNTCRNPPACVCLSILVTQPVDPITQGPETLDPTGTSTTAPTSTSPTNPSSETGEPIAVDAGAADAAADASASDAGPSGSTSEATTTIDTSTEFAEPTVCLEIVEFKRK